MILEAVYLKLCELVLLSGLVLSAPSACFWNFTSIYKVVFLFKGHVEVLR